MRIIGAIAITAALLVGLWPFAPSVAQPPEASSSPSNFRGDDGWLDVSGFLAEKYGFLPLALPITEPAVGYGAAVGLASISKPLGEARQGFGRPDITLVGGLGTENGSWGGLVGDVRHWLDDRLETLMRYQGEQMGQVEAELRWQFWRRFSAVVFVGGGAVWNDFARVESPRTVVTGGLGFRYELARRYGIHAGLDVAFGPDNAAVYVQVGSAWSRP